MMLVNFEHVWSLLQAKDIREREFSHFAVVISEFNASLTIERHSSLPYNVRYIYVAGWNANVYLYSHSTLL